MEIIVLSHGTEKIFTESLLSKLNAKGLVKLETAPKNISQIPSLHTNGEKILALDPDFVDWKFTKDDIDGIPNLKAICLQTTSFGWIDTAHAAAKGIPVTNLRGFSTEAVAEYAVFMMLGAARKFPLVMKDKYLQNVVKHQGLELIGKRVGVIGLGSIGKRFAELCKGMGIEVVYWSRSSRDERFTLVPLEELISSSDVVFPALAQNEQTQTLLTEALLRTLKPNAIFVSITHKLYDHELLLKLVKEKKLFGYAFEEDNGDPTAYEGNVFAVPSLAWATDESMKRNGEQWVEAITQAADGIFPTRVN